MAKSAKRLIKGQSINFATIDDMIDFSNGHLSLAEVEKRFNEREVENIRPMTMTVISCKKTSTVTFEAL